MNPITRRSGAQRPRPRGVQRPHSAGNARQKYERYLTRGREAQLAGDVVEMERCYQFADHYLRVMRAAAVLIPSMGGEDPMRTNLQPVDYKTHILIGVRANGAMTVIADWPHVPKQADDQKEIVRARDGYVTFVLCTPTAIIPAGGHGDAAEDRSFGSPRRW